MCSRQRPGKKKPSCNGIEQLGSVPFAAQIVESEGFWDNLGESPNG